MKYKLYKLLVILSFVAFIITISLFSLLLSLIIAVVLLVLYVLNKKIKEKIFAYDKYPTSTGSAGRNYATLHLGSSWLFCNKHNYTHEDFVEAMYSRKLPMMEFCLHKLFSLVRNGGCVVLYLDKDNCLQPSKSLSVIDKSYFWPCEQELYGIKYGLLDKRIPLLTDWFYFLKFALYYVAHKIKRKDTIWKKIMVDELQINEDAKMIVNRMQLFCKERNLSMKLLIEK